MRFIPHHQLRLGNFTQHSLKGRSGTAGGPIPTTALHLSIVNMVPHLTPVNISHKNIPVPIQTAFNKIFRIKQAKY